MTKYLLDTNVLLRFLLNDHKKPSPKARRLFRQAEAGKCQLILTEVALAEAVWVLTSFYESTRETVAESLSRLIGKSGIHCPNSVVLLDALHRFRDTKCDFLDCYLAAMSADSGHAVASFDCDFRKFPDIALWK
jgi:predicted nucleic-acid-binding protein